MISVLSVNYYSGIDLDALAASIRARSGDEAVELIVTNNSPEAPVAPASDDRLVTAVITPGTNAGYAVGINRAAREARGDILMIANPDVRVSPGALSAAAAVLREEADVGVVLPGLRSLDGSPQRSVRRFYTWPVTLYARSPLRMLGVRPAFFDRYLCVDLDRSQPTDVDWGLGGAMFVRRRDWPDGVIFDERFFMYFEDVDLCLRSWRQGRRVVFRPEIECVHAHRRASANPFGVAGWRHLRSFVRFVGKHRGLPQRPATPAEKA